LASFLSIFLRDQYGASKVQAGDLTSLCVMAGSFLRPVGGWLADKLGGIRMLMFLYGAVMLLGTAVATLPPLGASVTLLFAMMGCLGMGNGSVFQLVPQRFKERVGVATGILGAAGGLGGFFLPTLLGGLKQSTGSYATGLVVFAGIALLALVCLGVVQRGWIGVWIARHGRAYSSAASVLSPEEVEPA
jgi:NNP family nitrate/nitrite transporter-like MFS transporter